MQAEARCRALELRALHRLSRLLPYRQIKTNAERRALAACERRAPARHRALTAGHSGVRMRMAIRYAHVGDQGIEAAAERVGEIIGDILMPGTDCGNAPGSRHAPLTHDGQRENGRT